MEYSADAVGFCGISNKIAATCKGYAFTHKDLQWVMVRDTIMIKSVAVTVAYF